MKKGIFALLICCCSFQMYAQIDTVAVKTIEGITNKMIELISGEIDEPRNWEAYRYLFLATAQKISINRNAPPKRQVRVRNLEEFVREVGPFYKRDGFEEYAIGLTINEFNGIANVFQSFYCKNLVGTYKRRGINSYQLVYADDRWWIASTTFTNETKTALIPDKYLFMEHQSKKKD